MEREKLETFFGIMYVKFINNRTKTDSAENLSIISTDKAESRNVWSGRIDRRRLRQSRYQFVL